MLRTHMCGQVTNKINNISLCGWIDTIRDHGEIIFIMLRDQSGLIQCVFEKNMPEFFELRNIPKESVIQVHGNTIFREEKFINNNLATGTIELRVLSYKVLSLCKNNIDVNTNDDVIKSKYRYMFLRESEQRHKINMRCQIIKTIRDYMHDNFFQEIHTPILTGSSPEGARDFMVISRLYKDKYYALPQSPQIFKQLLMCAGFDRYFQIAPCFRDEDSRADRSPTEFYQLDLECAFVDQETVFSIIEGLIIKLFGHVTFHRLTYHESMQKYGTDKPDLRIPLYIEDMNNINIGIFSDNSKDLLGIRINRIFSRAEIEEIEILMKEYGYPGIGYISVVDNIISGSLKKHIDTEAILSMMKNHQTIFFIYDSLTKARTMCNKLIQYLGHKYFINTTNSIKYAFCWIKDFPMYELNDEGKYEFMHNPFSDVYNIDDIPSNMIAKQYDIVCNGLELGSGAIRNSSSEKMLKLFAHAGYSSEQVINNFPALYNAFDMGAPIHGGIALGIERIVMILTNSKYVRDVIAFPTLQNGIDYLMNAPSPMRS